MPRRHEGTKKRLYKTPVVSSWRHEPSVRQRRFHAFGVDAPHVAGLEVRQPDRSETDADRVATFAVELLDDRVGGRIDARQRELEGGHPHRSCTDGDVAAAAGYADVDRGGHLVRLRI